MVDHIVDATAPRGRVEIRRGVGRRRRWSDEDKGRIVAESYAPGAVVSGVARRQRSALSISLPGARRQGTASPADEAAMFVPVMMGAQKPGATTPSIMIVWFGLDAAWMSGGSRQCCAW
jgi:transposase